MTENGIVVIYTDGACIGNPGHGGWGAIILYGGDTKEISGAAPSTTNNRMELMAAIKGLSFLTRPCNVVLYTDSQYVQKGMTSWMHKWLKKDFAGIKNDDLWRELIAASARHNVAWQWVRGHSGDHWNERADKLATNAARSISSVPEVVKLKAIIDDGTIPWN